MDNIYDLSAALVEVRKAYRLTWSFQRRIFDVVRVARDSFDDRKFYYWQPYLFGRPSQGGTDPLMRWAWDMLPMYAVSFLFLGTGTDNNATKRGEWMLEVNFQADTGFNGGDGTKEPIVDDLPSVEESSSQMRLFAWLCTSDSELNWFNHVWKGAAWPLVDGQVAEPTDPPFRIVGQSFDIAELGDAVAVRSAVSKFKHTASSALGYQIS